MSPRNRTRRSVAARVALVVVVVSVLAGCSGGSGTSIATTSSAPAGGPAPGAVLAVEEVEAAPGADRTWKVDYASTSVRGASIVVSGVVATPHGDPPSGGWPVLTWAHGTTGVADACAPSSSADVLVPGMQEWLDAGYVVAATDYEGLGTPGVHPYLVLESEGRSVLDVVRAARELVPEAGTAVTIMGHSQGGHAALAANEIAAAWAPELTVERTVAIAPLADLEVMVPAEFGSPELFGLGVLVAAGWSDAYDDLDAADLLTPAGLDLVEDAATVCTDDLLGAALGSDIEDFVATPPAEVPAWAARIAQNTIHADRVEGPVLVVQGDADRIIPPILSTQLVDRLCALGVDVGEAVYAGADHGEVIDRSRADILAWLSSPASAPGAIRGCARR